MEQRGREQGVESSVQIGLKQMNVTVILCTFNRCQLLRTALESVALSAMPEETAWEVLVVDNHSTDGTRQVVEDFASRYPTRFRYLYEAQPGKSHALNAGIAHARGDLLAFIDDDVTVETNWLRHLVAPLQGGKYAAVGGRVFPQWTAEPPRWLAREGWVVSGPLVYFDRGNEGHALEESPVGANMAFQRRVFAQYGGFRTDLGPSPKNEIRNEDSEFARRLLGAGEPMYYEPSSVVYHYVAPERLRKKYFQRWWFDKGRSEIREAGVPKDAGKRIAGVPLSFFLRLARWTAQWLVTTEPRRRFECKLKAWLNAGMITECKSGSREGLEDGAQTARDASAAGFR